MLLVEKTTPYKEHGYVFFCNALYIHSSGPFQNGAKHQVLVF